MSTFCRLSVFATVPVISAILLWCPASSAPVPNGIPAIRVKLVGAMQIPDLAIEDAAILDESKVVAVGTLSEEKGGIEEPDRREPSGAILDLVKKTHRPFDNGHKSRIVTVSASGNRIVTTGNYRDPYLRVWDLKKDRAFAEIKIGVPGATTSLHFGAACFHKDDRIAVAADGKVFVVDPAKPDDRSHYDFPDGNEEWTNYKPVVSADDRWIAEYIGLGEVVFWDSVSKKAKSVKLAPEGKDKEVRWLSAEFVFGEKGAVFGFRHAEHREILENVLESKAPAERRGVVRIDLGKGTFEPLKMGHSNFTLACVIDPTETWLATGGNSHTDKPRKDDQTAGELRIYHLPTQTLVHKEQLEGLPLMWVAFTPSGKRIVAATADGNVRWWDIEKK